MCRSGPEEPRSPPPRNLPSASSCWFHCASCQCPCPRSRSSHTPGGGSARRASHAPPTPSSVVSIDPARRSDPPDPCSRPAIYRLALCRFPSVPPVSRNKRFTQNSKHPLAVASLPVLHLWPQRLEVFVQT